MSWLLGERQTGSEKAVEDRSFFAGECWRSLTGPSAGLFGFAGSLADVYVYVCVGVGRWVGECEREHDKAIYRTLKRVFLEN